MNTIIILHLKNSQIPDLKDNLHYFGYNRIDFSDTLGDLPINDILTYVATAIGAGGITTIATELMNRKKKDIKIEESKDGIKIDCTNATTSEVIELLQKVHEIQNNQKEET